MKNNEGMFFSERTLDYGTNPKHYGDMNRPDGYSRVTGPCGDTAEIYLRIQEGSIREATFITDGCLYSLAACNAAAHLAIGKTLHQCFSIDQRAILEHLNGLPDDHVHCALLAATTLYKAVSNYVMNHKASPATKSKSSKDITKIKACHTRPSRQKMKDQILL